VSDADWVWFARLDTAPTDAWVSAPVRDPGGRDVGYVAAWSAGRKPLATAVRADARLFSPDGAAAAVSLVLLPRGRAPLHDDPAVSGALRDVLAGPRADGVCTLVRDATHWVGSLTVRRHDTARLRDDPFTRLGPAERLEVPAGVFGVAPTPPGPGIQRYAGKPWPASGFGTL
jgi:hypothetical protein